MQRTTQHIMQICLHSSNQASLALLLATFTTVALTSLLAWLLVVGTDVEYRRLMKDQQCANVEISIAKFVPTELLVLLGHTKMMDVKNGDRTLLNTAVMFSGLRDFTAIASKLTADETFEWLMNFTSIMTPIVRSKKGLIDKYLGDGFMILNRVPTLALSTAIEIQAATDVLNETGDHKATMGIGIHSGVVCVGTLGDSGRLDTTLISNVVNLASRFELLTKYYGCRILISLTCAKRIRIEKYAHRSLGGVRVKGSREVHDLVDVFSTDPIDDRIFKGETKDEFELGIRLYRDRNFEHAMKKFRYKLGAGKEDNPAQKAAQMKLYFCSKYHREGVPYDGWMGEDVWDKK
eukprot:TRINITY_DN5766_c3_g1_i1.p1 TRINITY_DN5766_c3_g1~~TRINITY_DN5766_c3_g1_i1.p1  ORF type:complete len:349 (+),score=81.65 TRINITY_DN5766_c3_g1_i1:353-1399(+)